MIGLSWKHGNVVFHPSDSILSLNFGQHKGGGNAGFIFFSFLFFMENVEKYFGDESLMKA